MLFSERHQQVFALNGAAACMADAMGDGRASSILDLTERLATAGLERSVAEQSVKSTIATWSQSGLVDAEVTDGPCICRHTIRVGGHLIDLLFEEAELAGCLIPALRHLEVESMPSQTWRIGGRDGLATISRPGKPVIVTKPSGLAPALKTALSQHLMDLTDAFSALHAACLVRDGKALLLFGPPGAGKSTLTARLECAGFQLGGDDLAFLDFDGMVTPVDFPMTIKSGSWPLLARVRPDIARYPDHLRMDGKQVRYLPPTKPTIRNPLPIGWTVRLSRSQDTPASIAPRAVPAALTDILGEAFSARGQTRVKDLHMVLDVLSRAHSYELDYSDLDDACALLERTCSLG